jgi:hypothetical protein
MIGGAAPGMPAARCGGVSASHQSGSFVLPTSATPATGLAAVSRASEHRAVGRLAALVGDVVTQLEAQAVGLELRGAVSECNASLELYLEMQRDVCDLDERPDTAAEDLRRLARLVTAVERADVPMVLRQIRRVLGRLDPAH